MNHRFCFTAFLSLFVFSFYSLTYSADTPTQGTNTVTEVVSGRNQNTRVWNNGSGIYYEKSDNLCFNSSITDTPNWQPVIEAFSIDPNYAYSALQGVYQVKVNSNFASGTPIEYQIQNKSISLGVKYLSYLDKSSGTYVKIATLSGSQIPNTAISNQLYYTNVFPNVDIKYEYTRSQFMQDAIINSISNLPSPNSLGLNPASTYLMVGTQVNWATSEVELVSNGQVYSGSVLSATNLPIDINDASSHNWLASFSPSQALDNNNTSQEMYKELVRENGTDILYEGVPYSWLVSASMPVTLDYQIRSGGQSGNETWLAGNTYYISSTVPNISYTVNGSWTLVIQGGAIIKLGPGNQLVAGSSGRIIAQGSPYNYILFSSKNDNTVGETILGSTGSPTSGDYGRAILLDTGSSSGSIVQYCKIYYATEGILINNNGTLSHPIENNIIRFCGDGIYLDAIDTCTVINNLITNCNSNAGIFAGAVSGYNTTTFLVAKNNTIDTCNTGVYVDAAWFADFSDNLVTSCGTALVDVFSGNLGYLTGTHDYNTFYNNGVNYYGASQSSNETTITQNPYTISSNGSYYLNPLVAGCIDRGNTTAQVLGLDSKTVRAPLPVTSNVYPSAVWTPVMRDRGTVDIGYHYDPVDVIVGNASDSVIAVNSGATLTIKPGVVVTYWRDMNTVNAELYLSDLRDSGHSQIIARGDVNNPILFTSLWATNDQMNYALGTGAWAYNVAIGLEDYSSNSSEIRNCIFQYANIGTYVANSGINVFPIQDNVFTNCNKAIYTNECAIPSGSTYYPFVKFSNNLITNPAPGGTGIYWQYAGGYILNNTLDGNNTASIGINIFAYSPVTSAYNIITDFTGYDVTGATTSGGYYYLLNNTFFDCSTKSLTGSYTETSSQDICPQYASSTSGGEFNGYYLAQVSGDVSKFPLQISSVSGMSFSFVSTPPRGVKITISSYANGLSGSTQLGYATTLNGGGWSYTSTGSRLGNILITLSAGANGWTISSTDSITLLFGSDSIQVCLPKVSVYEGQVWYWAALDGSSYRVNTGMTGIYEDAWYAMNYDSNGLVKASFSQLGQSPCVGYGGSSSVTAALSNLQYASTRTDGLRNGRISLSGYLLDAGYHYPSFASGPSSSILYENEYVAISNGGQLYLYWPKAMFDNNTGHVITSDSDSSGYSGLTVLDGASSVPYAPTQWEITAPDGIDNPPIYGVVLDSTTKMDTISGGAYSGYPIIRIKTVGPNRVYIDGVETDVLERGKYAAAGSTGVALAISTTNVMQFYAQFTSGINYQISWNGAGLFTESSPTNLPSFIKNAGSNDPNNGEASLLYLSTGSTYGESTNMVINFATGATTYFFAPGNGTTPTIDSTADWTQGLKWFMSESENMLGYSTTGDINPTAYLSYWSPALIKASANGSIPHMILGTWRSGFSHDTGPILGVLTTFFQYATNGPVADAWVVDAGNKYSPNPNPFAALMHYDNKEDTLVQPTPDSADRTMRYIYVSSSLEISTSYVTWNLPVVNPDDYRLASRGKIILPKYPEKPYLIPEEISNKQINKGLFDNVTHLSGYLKLDRKINALDVALQMSDEQAEKIARATLQKQTGGIPQDMKLVGVNNLMVGLFDAEHVKETYHEIVKTKQLTFAHVKDRQQIYANGIPDCITVSIDANGVQSIERQWHKLVMR